MHVYISDFGPYIFLGLFLVYCRLKMWSDVHNALRCLLHQWVERSGKGLLLKWTPSLEATVWSKNHNQAKITILRSTQPCSSLAQSSSIKSNSKENKKDVLESVKL